MAFPIFPTGNDYAPSKGASATHENNILSTDFGNGYRQVARDGFNNATQKWSLSWGNAKITTVGDTIINFLNARGADQIFSWTPPKSGATALNFRCSGFTETYNYTSNVVSISATFEQAFDFEA